jgi:two-component system, NtrC family, sensor kinase
MDPTATPETRRLLLVDDEEFILRALRRVLRPGDWEIHTANSGPEAIALFQAQQPDVVVSDYRMPGMTGIELLTRIKDLKPGTQRILLTGDADQHALEDAINRSEVFRFVSKPWNDIQLLMTVRNAFEQHAATVENERLLALTQEQNRELRGLNQALDLKVAERTQALSLAKREWELTFDTLNRPVALIDTATWGVQRANRAYGEVAGRELKELAGHPPCHRFLFGRSSPCPGCPLLGTVPPGGAQGEVQHGVRTYAVSVNLLPDEARAVCNYRDVTDERALTRSLIETEKMVSVGTLAGGVAHEINNPLGGILAFAQLMKREPDRSPEDQESLALIEESALRCKSIVESLLKFARKSRIDEKKPFSVARCTDDTVGLFRMQLARVPKVKVEVRHLGDAPEVEGDAGQLAQVVLNLLQNALHAVGEGPAELVVETGVEGSACFVRVTDTGPGIAPEVLPLIFEPYYTTKPPGVGTGLGLSIAQRIVRDHGGRMQVETAPQEGCRFTVFLPSLTERP